MQVVASFILDAWGIWLRRRSLELAKKRRGPAADSLRVLVRICEGVSGYGSILQGAWMNDAANIKRLPLQSLARALGCDAVAQHAAMDLLQHVAARDNNAAVAQQVQV